MEDRLIPKYTLGKRKKLIQNTAKLFENRVELWIKLPLRKTRNTGDYIMLDMSTTL